MLDNRRIDQIVTEAAERHVPPGSLDRVVAEVMTDSQGEDALRITLVLQPSQVAELTGDQAVDILVSVQRRLLEEGEDRLPIIEYATAQDLDGEEPFGTNELADEDG